MGCIRTGFRRGLTVVAEVGSGLLLVPGSPEVDKTTVTVERILSAGYRHLRVTLVYITYYFPVPNISEISEAVVIDAIAFRIGQECPFAIGAIQPVLPPALCHIHIHLDVSPTTTIVLQRLYHGPVLSGPLCQDKREGSLS